MDRGDLSREIPLEKIPFIQKMITKKAKEVGKEIFIATNTLENMAEDLKPSKAETNDIVNSLFDGVSGFVLTKEIAIGKHPVETMNMLINIIKEFEKYQINSNIDLNNMQSNLLPSPHGGKLINRFFKKNLRKEEINSLKKINIDLETLMDLEQIANGSFSPLEGFMNKKDLQSVLQHMRLEDGTIWPLPITLQVSDIFGLKQGEDILLMYKGESYGILHLKEIYQPSKENFIKKAFGTEDRRHPGVDKFMNKGNYFLGGKISLIKKRHTKSKLYELTPSQTRQIFSEKGWSKVVGFHTRKVIHKSHEFIQLEAMKNNFCDALFVHPVVGKKKKGDFEAEIIIESYEKMINKFYPKGKVIFSVFPTYSRYAGPREALFTAIVRKNFGCSHFIVGRDHTGVGNFYDPEASHKIFNNFKIDELGIFPVKFNKVFYSNLYNKHIHDAGQLNHPEENKMQISGTQAREMLQKMKNPPEWFMRPEISNLIIKKIKKGEKVFVE